MLAYDNYHANISWWVILICQHMSACILITCHSLDVGMLISTSDYRACQQMFACYRSAFQHTFSCHRSHANICLNLKKTCQHMLTCWLSLDNTCWFCDVIEGFLETLDEGDGRRRKRSRENEDRQKESETDSWYYWRFRSDKKRQICIFLIYCFYFLGVWVILGKG